MDISSYGKSPFLAITSIVADLKPDIPNLLANLEKSGSVPITMELIDEGARIYNLPWVSRGANFGDESFYIGALSALNLIDNHISNNGLKFEEGGKSLCEFARKLILECHDGIRNKP